MSRLIRLSVVVLASILILSGCTRTVQPTITFVSVSTDGSTLGITIDRCRNDLPVRVSETSTEVHLKVATFRSNGSEPGCASGTQVRLASPLGTRIVIDDATGNRLGVEPPTP